MDVIQHGFRELWVQIRLTIDFVRHGGSKRKRMTSRLLLRGTISDERGQLVLELDYTLMLRHNHVSNAPIIMLTLDRLGPSVSGPANSIPWVS